SRNMQNFTLLKTVGKTTKPVLLKRGMGSTIEELLYAAEYIMNEGNTQVILCERGIRTFESYSRFTLDISAVPLIKELSHLPIIVDPSHSSGRSDIVKPMALAAVAAGAHGLLIEVHNEPEKALCDGHQSLNPSAFGSLMEELNAIARALNRGL
ncbi:MAG: N-acetylneuraminate synthase family protein, partial [Thermoplasmata archaeon]